MVHLMSRKLFYIGSLLACAFMAMSSGCASGGYKLSRSFAGWINDKNVFLRVILYIFTGGLFLFTLIIDLLVFNTLDFWQGKISAGDYQFKEGGKTYFAKHEFIPGTQLKKSTLRVKDENQKLIQEVVLAETSEGMIETYIDGKLRGQVRDITTVPVASLFDENGKLTNDKILWDVVLNVPAVLARK